VPLIRTRYKILVLSPIAVELGTKQTRDDGFMGPRKQPISKRSLWWTAKRRDTTNNSLD
jgi:hypothetical protein